ncbi:MAG: DNA/RNA non-specific endonuclease, partial [Firmicutes bacterium]|nr:DNA/RNA non-specific endonuclease [Bacillota bacterium]
MLERFDDVVLDPVKQGVVRALTRPEMHESFSSAVKPEGGFYGFKETIKDNGRVERTWRTENGNLFKEYLQDGRLVQTREKLPSGPILETKYDDNGTAYCTSKATPGSKETGYRVVDRQTSLTPEVAIQKGNITTYTDALGRPSKAIVTDLTANNSRDSLNSIFRDSTYRPNDDKGDLIPKRFGGRSSPENIVPQDLTVNRGLVKRVENIAADLKAQGKTVDYEIKPNYVGSNKRPSSFEITIKADGEVIELPDNLRKIYNSTDQSQIGAATTNLGERFGLSHEAGIKSGLTAAALTAAVSTVDNIRQVMNGEITAQEAFVDVAKDTGIAGAVGYGTTFVSHAVTTAMEVSTHKLISSMGKLGVPAAVISFGVASFDSVVDFAQGEIDGKQLALELGENAVSVAAGMAGMVAVAPLAASAAGVGGVIGGAIGSVIPIVGTAAGAAAGAFVAGTAVSMVGSMVS